MALEIKSRGSTYHSSKNIRHQGVAKRRIIRTISTIFILLLLLVIAALGYTWYLGKYQKPVVVDTPQPKKNKVIEPPKQFDETVKVGVSSQTFTDKVAPGKNASLYIRTNPLAACSIRVEYNKEASTDSGLVPKKADEYGVASWAWTVEESRPVGKWPVIVTCANAKNSGVLQLDLYVVRE
jgi:hypothetical protein